MKTADQAPNQSQPSQYASNSQNLSRYSAKLIEAGIGFHPSEIEETKLLGFLAEIILEHKHALIERVMLKLPDPSDRIEFALMFQIALALRPLALQERGSRAAATDPLPRLPVPGLMNHWPAVLGDALVMIASPIYQNTAAIAALAPSLEPIDAVNLACALRAAECRIRADLSEDELRETPANALLIEQTARWADQWAVINTNPKIRSAELDRLLRKLPGNGSEKSKTHRHRETDSTGIISVAEAKRRARLGNRSSNRIAKPMPGPLARQTQNANT